MIQITCSADGRRAEHASAAAFVYIAGMKIPTIVISGIVRRAGAALALSIIAGSALSGCAVEWTRDHPLYCRMDEQRLIRDTLYFGLSIPGGGEVADADWRSFESDALAPAFPKGFTVLASTGAWRGANDALVTEPGRVVVVVHDEDAASESAIRNVIARYRTMFHQEAVLRERGAVCVTLQSER